MNEREIGENMAKFGMALNRLAHVRSQIEPRMPNEFPVAQEHCIKYSQNPDTFSLSLLNQIGEDWDKVESDYLREVEGCESRIGDLRIPDTEKQILRNGYRALKLHSKNIGDRLRKYRKIQASSEFSEGKVNEFASWMHDKAPGIYHELQGSREERGGLIFYTEPVFDVQFKPNKAGKELKRMIKGFRRGKPQAINSLYSLSKERIKAEIQKAYAVMPEEEVERRFGHIVDDNERLPDGIMTKPLESYLTRLFADVYGHDSEHVFADDSLFSGPGKRLFAYFHHHRDSPDIHYADNFRGPAPDDVKITWEIGPQVLFAPEKGKMNVYFMSRGNSGLIETYSV